jgi:nucleotide-binding universal stress UspA family protein
MSDEIVVGTDGSPQAAHAVDWAVSLAKRAGMKLLIVHVFEVDPSKLPGGYAVLPQEDVDRIREYSRQCLEGDWSEPARKTGVSFRTILIDGNASGALLEIAKKEQASQIVVGNRGRGGFSELLLGSCGHQLTQHTTIPVTIVPSRRA